MTPRTDARSTGRRRRAGLSLRVTQARTDELDPRARTVAVPWVPAAVGGGVLAGLIGWVLCALIAVLGWLGANASTLGHALDAGSQLWFLSHGAGARLGPLSWTLTPLGLTAGFIVLVSWVAAFAARQAHAQTGLAPGRLTRTVTGFVMAGYTGALLVACVLLGEPAQLGRALLGGLVVSAVGGWWGASRASRYRLGSGWPRWARAVPGAVLAAQATIVGLGAVVVAAALIGNADKVTRLTTSLHLGVLGGLVMLALQLAYLPNLVLWAAAYLIGSGFSLGDGSLVSPVVTKLGLLPAVPVTAAVPAAHIGDTASLWWLIGGALPGVVAAIIVVRARPLARFDETSLVGGLAGVGSGLVFALIAATSRGRLGAGRLAGLGPRPTELTVLAVTLMGLAGLLTGLVWGLVRYRSWAAQPADGKDSPHPVSEPDPVDEPEPVGDVHAVDEENEPTRRVPRL